MARKHHGIKGCLILDGNRICRRTVGTNGQAIVCDDHLTRMKLGETLRLTAKATPEEQKVFGILEDKHFDTINISDSMAKEDSTENSKADKTKEETAASDKPSEKSSNATDVLTFARLAAFLTFLAALILWIQADVLKFPKEIGFTGFDTTATAIQTIPLAAITLIFAILLFFALTFVLGAVALAALPFIILALAVFAVFWDVLLRATRLPPLASAFLFSIAKRDSVLAFSRRSRVMHRWLRRKQRKWSYGLKAIKAWGSWLVKRAGLPYRIAVNRILLGAGPEAKVFRARMAASMIVVIFCSMMVGTIAKDRNRHIFRIAHECHKYAASIWCDPQGDPEGNTEGDHDEGLKMPTAPNWDRLDTWLLVEPAGRSERQKFATVQLAHAQSPDVRSICWIKNPLPWGQDCVWNARAPQTFARETNHMFRLARVDAARLLHKYFYQPVRYVRDKVSPRPAYGTLTYSAGAVSPKATHISAIPETVGNSSFVTEKLILVGDFGEWTLVARHTNPLERILIRRSAIAEFSQKSEPQIVKPDTEEPQTEEDPPWIMSLNKQIEMNRNTIAANTSLIEEAISKIGQTETQVAAVSTKIDMLPLVNTPGDAPVLTVIPIIHNDIENGGGSVTLPWNEGITNAIAEGISARVPGMVNDIYRTYGHDGLLACRATDGLGRINFADGADRWDLNQKNEEFENALQDLQKLTEGFNSGDVPHLILLQGGASFTGNSDENLALSEARAKWVMSQFLARLFVEETKAAGGTPDIADLAARATVEKGLKFIPLGIGERMPSSGQTGRAVEIYQCNSPKTAPQSNPTEPELAAAEGASKKAPPLRN